MNQIYVEILDIEKVSTFSLSGSVIRAETKFQYNEHKRQSKDIPEIMSKKGDIRGIVIESV